MTSRERVLASIAGQKVDRIPRDLGGMRSTGISAFAYPKLVAHLGLAPRRVRVHDTGQMLALPDLDVLDALGCDCVVAEDTITNAFPQPELWKDYDFNGRLAAQVLNPAAFVAQPDGSIMQGGSKMVPESTVFSWVGTGQAEDWLAEIPKPDLKQVAESQQKALLSPEGAQAYAAHYAKVRAAANDRAVFAACGAVNVNISATGWCGWTFPILCVEEPELVAAYHDIITTRVERNVALLMPLIKDAIDILIIAADDWGTQNALLASPEVYRTCFKPFHRRVNDAIHAAAPNVKTFLHSCGAIHEIVGDIAEGGFDILGPVQWNAGGHTVKEWRDAAGDMTLWGGGVNSQVTLPLKSIPEIKAEVARVVPELSREGRYVFCNIHNLLAEISPEKITALYSTP